MKLLIAASGLIFASAIVLWLTTAPPVQAIERTARLPHAYHVVRTWPLMGPTPHFTGVDGNAQIVYISHLAGGTVTEVDAHTGTLLNTVRVGGTLHTVMVDSAAHLIYVTDITGNQLIAIHGKDVVTRIPVGPAPHGLALSLPDHRAYVSSIGSNALNVIDLRTHRQIASIPVGPEPWGAAVDWGKHHAYTANTGQKPDGTEDPNGNSITEVDTYTLKRTRTWVVGPHPWHVIVDPVDHSVYASVTGKNCVAVICGNRIEKWIKVGRSPHGLAIDPQRRTLFVNNTGDNSVSVIYTRTKTVLQTLPVGKQPQGISVDLRTGRVYIANQAENSVTVLSPNTP